MASHHGVAQQSHPQVQKGEMPSDANIRGQLARRLLLDSIPLLVQSIFPIAVSITHETLQIMNVPDVSAFA